MNGYTYPSGHTTGETVSTPAGLGTVTFPGGGNGTAPGWVAVRVGDLTLKYPARKVVAS